MAVVFVGIPELDETSFDNSDQLNNVQVVVAWYPPTDFLKMDEWLAEWGFLPVPGSAYNGENSPESKLLVRKITEVPDL